jgi:hypothetical protein
MPTPADTLTKEQLISEVKNSGCLLMTGLPLKVLSKEAIMVHLTHCNCPKLKQLIREKKI